MPTCDSDAFLDDVQDRHPAAFVTHRVRGGDGSNVPGHGWIAVWHWARTARVMQLELKELG